MKTFINYIFFFLLLSNFSYNSQSADLTRQKEIEKVVLLKGEKGKKSAIVLRECATVNIILLQHYSQSQYLQEKFKYL